MNRTPVIGAVTLKVADLEKVKVFYQQVLGLIGRDQTSERAVLGTALQDLIVLHHVPDGTFESGTTGLYHLALLVSTREDLSRWFQHYVNLGTPNYQGASDHGVSEAIYLSDPEGNGIEVYRDRAYEDWPLTTDGRIAMFTRTLDLNDLMQMDNGKPWSSMPDETIMGHVHLRVADIEATESFYRNVFGFEIKMRYGAQATFLAMDDYHHHIGANNWHSVGARTLPEQGYGLSHFELFVTDDLALHKIKRQLEMANAEYGFEDEQIWVSDPSGNRIHVRVKK